MLREWSFITRRGGGVWKSWWGGCNFFLPKEGGFYFFFLLLWRQCHIEISKISPDPPLYSLTYILSYRYPQLLLKRWQDTDPQCLQAGQGGGVCNFSRDAKGGGCCFLKTCVPISRPPPPGNNRPLPYNGFTFVSSNSI